VPVVLEQVEAQPLELSVRREHVHEIDLAARDRAIGERVLHDVGAGQAQAVERPQARPAVLALEKARAERGAQLGIGEDEESRDAQHPGAQTAATARQATRVMRRILPATTAAYDRGHGLEPAAGVAVSVTDVPWP